MINKLKRELEQVCEKLTSLESLARSHGFSGFLYTKEEHEAALRRIGASLERLFFKVDKLIGDEE